MSLSFILQSAPGGAPALVSQGTAASAREVLPAIVEAGSDDATGVLLKDGSLPDDFFDLRSGFAGEVLQKLVTYRMRAAIVYGNRPLSDRFTELVREHRNYSNVRFFETEAEATAWLRQ